MAAKKWTCALAMGCYPGGLPIEPEERSPILRSTEHPHPQAHIFQGQTQWRFQMRRPQPKITEATHKDTVAFIHLSIFMPPLRQSDSKRISLSGHNCFSQADHARTLIAFFHLFPLSLFRAYLPLAMLAMLPVAALYSQPLPLH